MIITDQIAAYVFKTSGIPPVVEEKIGRYMAEKHGVSYEYTKQYKNLPMEVGSRRIIFDVIKNNGPIKTRKVSEITGFSINSVSQHIWHLEKYGKIKCVDQIKRGSYYIKTFMANADVYGERPASKRKAMNKEKVVQAIKKYGPLTRSQVADKSGFKLSTIASYMPELVKDGLVVKIPRRNDKSGNSTVRYEVKK